ncbi:DNA repair protein RadC [Bacillus cereus]|nr:DNA repair protein RadC [Bacillus cereus]
MEITSKSYLLLSSGHSIESREDIEATRRLKECGDIIGIRLLDHVIIGDNNFVSLRRKGIN